MAGRKPKPTAVKKLEGNPGKRSSLVSAIREGVSGMNGGGGDIVIPVYLGGTMLDEVIVNAQQRANLRSGGR